MTLEGPLIIALHNYPLIHEASYCADLTPVEPASRWIASHMSRYYGLRGIGQKSSRQGHALAKLSHPHTFPPPRCVVGGAVKVTGRGWESGFELTPAGARESHGARWDGAHLACPCHVVG